ncbi:hypothetical protein NMG60_11034632 [Bertholletia excelsa]
MLLRSSSTPVLGSLLSCFSESPIHQSSEPHAAVKHPATVVHHPNRNKFSSHPYGPPNSTFSCNSFPISPSVADSSAGGRRFESEFRRAQSEGNLEGLENSSCNPDEFIVSNPIKKFPRRPNCSILEPIPSFSFHNANNGCEDEDSDEEENCGFIESSIRREEKSGLTEKGFLKAYRGLGLEENQEHRSEMYLARGLGIDTMSVGVGGGGGGGGVSTPIAYGGGGGGGGRNMEEHYKRLVEENPGDPLLLRNYAEFLHEEKRDLARAEEYYSRAILADPEDGEILSKYGKVVWELHRDQDRASSYFERAVQAAPDDSHVHAAYASFLWETEEDEDDDRANDPPALPSHFHNGAMAPATA